MVALTIYVAAIPTLKDTYKVGKTTKPVRRRVKYLHKEYGQMVPFVVEAYYKSIRENSCPINIEALVHRELGGQANSSEIYTCNDSSAITSVIEEKFGHWLERQKVTLIDRQIELINDYVIVEGNPLFGVGLYWMNNRYALLKNGEVLAEGFDYDIFLKLKSNSGYQVSNGLIEKVGELKDSVIMAEKTENGWIKNIRVIQPNGEVFEFDLTPKSKKTLENGTIFQKIKSKIW